MNQKFDLRRYIHKIQAGQHGAERRHPERGKIRPCGQGTLPQVWHQWLTKLVADQAIEIQLFKDITSKTWCKTGQESVVQRAPRHGNDASEKSQPADELVQPEVEIRHLLHLAADGDFSRLEILDMPARQAPQPVDWIDVTSCQNNRSTISSGGMDDCGYGSFRHEQGEMDSRKIPRKTVQRVFQGKRFSRVVGGEFAGAGGEMLTAYIAS